MAVKAFKLTRAALDNPIIYIMRFPDGTLYVGESGRLSKHGYTKAQLDTIVHVRKACKNKQARQRQEQQLIADLTALGYRLRNVKIETRDPAPIWTSCDAPNQPARRKHWTPDPDPDPDDPDPDPD
jgi:hypothetical protein